MKEIPLTQGYVALIDNEDFERLNQFKWYCMLDRGRKTRYAVRQIRHPEGGFYTYGKYTRPRQRTVRMHNEILSIKDGFVTDHIDGNGLNNCRNNLRYATLSQNTSNRKILKHNSVRGSSFRGVYKTYKSQTWSAAIKHNKKLIYLGSFIHEVDAAKAYDLAALKYHKEFAVLNFNNI